MAGDMESRPGSPYILKPRNPGFDDITFEQVMRWGNQIRPWVSIKGRSRRKKHIQSVKRLLRAAMELIQRCKSDRLSFSDYRWTISSTGCITFSYSGWKVLIDIAIYDPIRRELVVSREGMEHSLHGLSREYLRDFVQEMRMQIWYDNRRG